MAYRFSQFNGIRPARRGLWALSADMRFELGKGSDIWLTVPKDFTSDGPSIPPLARVLFNPANSRFMRAALVHDFLLGKGISPTIAAVAFRDALRAARVKEWRVQAMFLAVWFHTVIVRSVIAK